MNYLLVSKLVPALYPQQLPLSCFPADSESGENSALLLAIAASVLAQYPTPNARKGDADKCFESEIGILSSRNRPDKSEFLLVPRLVRG